MNLIYLYFPDLTLTTAEEENKITLQLLDNQANVIYHPFQKEILIPFQEGEAKRFLDRVNPFCHHLMLEFPYGNEIALTENYQVTLALYESFFHWWHQGDLNQYLGIEYQADREIEKTIEDLYYAYHRSEILDERFRKLVWIVLQFAGLTTGIDTYSDDSESEEEEDVAINFEENIQLKHLFGETLQLYENRFRQIERLLEEMQKRSLHLSRKHPNQQKKDYPNETTSISR